MSLTRERPGAWLAGLLDQDATVPVGIVLAILEQRPVRFKSLPTGLATAATTGTGTLPRTVAATR